MMEGIMQLGNKKFKVRFYEKFEGSPILKEELELTYFEIATYLITNEIERIDIIE